ncbi:gamma-glutamyltransferase [Opitutaceae bacterium EW11]|nr:gamma-glutamyltransferase [Opitutaceae bacterium EW11]
MPLQAQRRPVESPNGMVASAHALASQIGVDCLRQGGNAVDAAVATGLALSVVYPRAGNLGGGGFLLIRLADGRTTLIDFRETAPAAATRTMFQDAQGNVVADRSTVGYLASGVPGTVAGFALAWEKYGSGKLSWSQLVEPARQLAEKGFVVSPYFAQDLRASRDLLGKNAESTRVYLNGGKLFAAGDRFVQPDLAATLRRLQERGSREFYEGETARLIAEDMQAHGGLVRRDDLKSYRAVERAPLHGSYRGFEVIAPPPPSSGGVALLQILGMIEPYDVAAMGTNSAAKIHLFTEAMRRAFRDRAEYLGDPDFVRVPVAGLLEPKYLKTRMADFDPEKATPSASLPAGSPLSGESHETTHYSVVDAAGNAASCTYTLNGLYGSGVTAAGTGVLLNNEMDDFTAKVGVKNLYGLMQGESNAVAPGKRPLSSMTPTIVLKNHAPFLVTGSPGGPTIITTTLFVVTNVIDHSMSVTQAVDAPRFHHQWQPDVVNYEPFFTSQDTMALLRAKGHVLQPRKLYPNDPDAAARYWGDAESILIDPKTQLRQGANDPRNPESTVAGY